MEDNHKGSIFSDFAVKFTFCLIIRSIAVAVAVAVEVQEVRETEVLPKPKPQNELFEIRGTDMVALPRGKRRRA